MVNHDHAVTVLADADSLDRPEGDGPANAQQSTHQTHSNRLYSTDSSKSTRSHNGNCWVPCLRDLELVIDAVQGLLRQDQEAALGQALAVHLEGVTGEERRAVPLDESRQALMVQEKTIEFLSDNEALACQTVAKHWTARRRPSGRGAMQGSYTIHAPSSSCREIDGPTAAGA